ncbi:uncharacterized protein LOC135496844 [Lineus longissimus]|uniref:uncharacterized protein LOC135496844 n=1 Tax=Lineus longissimus TaxID=88925 RepID=UPI002B4C5067
MHYISIIPFLVATACLVEAGPVCPPGTKRYYNQKIDKEVCCMDIHCHRGEQPEPCDLSSTTPSCRPCPEGTYQPLGRLLSDRTYSNCRMKKACDFPIDKGTPYRDAKCGCPPDKWDSGDGMCFPRPFCSPGYGQTTSGVCERCTDGTTYSDENSNTANCKVVTNCEAKGRCTLTTATIESDSVCGTKTIDLRRCQITQKPTKSTEPYNQSTTGRPTKPLSTNPKILSTENTTIIVFAVLGGLILIAILVFFVVYSVKRRKSKNLSLQALHVNYAEKISKVADVQVKPIKEGVFQIVEDFLAETAPDQWVTLGGLLLGNAFDEKRDEISGNDISDSEKMREMLGEWKERCQTEGPDLEFLFKSMYSKKTREIYKFKAVIDDIEKEYGTTIGVAVTLPNNYNCNNCVTFRFPCLKYHDDDGSEYISSTGGLLGVKDYDEVKTPIRGSENLLCVGEPEQFVSTV